MLREAVPALRGGTTGEVTARIPEEEGIGNVPRATRTDIGRRGALTARGGDAVAWGEEGETIRAAKNGWSGPPEVGVSGGNMGGSGGARRGARV